MEAMILRLRDVSPRYLDQISDWSDWASGKNLDAGRDLLRSLLAKDASFRLIVSGHIGVKEIERLIKKLELDKEILAEQENEEVVERSGVFG